MDMVSALCTVFKKASKVIFNEEAAAGQESSKEHSRHMELQV